MNHSPIVRSTLFIVAAAAVAACSSGGGSSTTTSAPAPAASPTSRPATTAAASAPSASASAAVTPALVALGDSIYHAATCQRCHGTDAKGRQNGPSLLGPTFLHIKGSGTYQDFVNIIMSGVPADSIKDKRHTLPMRQKGGGQTPLTDDQVKAVAAYVYSLSHK
jgi:mono/diheme cytochrome c family protein